MTGKIKLVHSGGNAVSIAVPTSNPSSSEVEFKLPQADGTSGQALVTDSSGNLSFASVAGGKLLQLQSVTKTDTASVTDGTADIPGLSITITPASASSKFYITGKVQLSRMYGSVSSCLITVNGTVVGNADTAGSRHLAHTGMGYQQTSDQYQSVGIPVDFLVDASNANAHTIKLQMSQPVTGFTRTTWINRGQTDPDGNAGPRYVSTLTVMEIAP